MIQTCSDDLHLHTTNYYTLFETVFPYITNSLPERDGGRVVGEAG